MRMEFSVPEMLNPGGEENNAAYAGFCGFHFCCFKEHAMQRTSEIQNFRIIYRP